MTPDDLYFAAFLQSRKALSKSQKSLLSNPTGRTVIGLQLPLVTDTLARGLLCFGNYDPRPKQRNSGPNNFSDEITTYKPHEYNSKL